jgi:competence protein ComEC
MRGTVPAWTLIVPFAALFLLLFVKGQQGDGRLHLWVLDVGQGDAIFVRTPLGRTALVDGGPGATPLLNGVGERIPFWQHNLDLVVLTHPHSDHIMGLPELVERYGVGQVVQTPFTATGAVQTEWLHLLQDKKVSVYHPRRGDTIRFEGEPDLDMHVLSPERTIPSRDVESNNTSIVIKLSYGKHDILLPGDAQAEVEEALARSVGAGLASEILKVGHHGSATSSTPRFLQMVRPKVAIISVAADNRFGHPAPETLDALQSAGVQVYRTDQDGTVEIIADTERMWIRTER